MKKALALLIVLVVMAIPMVAFAAEGDEVAPGVEKPVGDTHDGFYMLPEITPAPAPTELPAIDPAAVAPIPAAGPAVFAGLSAVMALLGCTLIPKK